MKEREIKDIDRRMKSLKLVYKRLKPFYEHLEQTKAQLHTLNDESLEEIRELRCPETPIIKLFQVIGIVFGLSGVEVLNWDDLEEHNEQHWHKECQKYCTRETIHKMIQFDLHKVSEISKELLRGLSQDPTMAQANLAKVSPTAGVLAEYLMALYSYLVAVDTVDTDEPIDDLHELRVQLKTLKKEKQGLLSQVLTSQA
jgi:hypothetical protein